MNVLRKLALLSGIDFLHVGTPNALIKSIEKRTLIDEFRDLKKSFVPVFTKTYPGVVNNYICDVSPKIILACGYFRNQRGDITGIWSIIG